MWNTNHVIVILYNVAPKKNFPNDFHIETQNIFMCMLFAPLQGSWYSVLCDNTECSVSNNWMSVNRLRFNYSLRFLSYHQTTSHVRIYTPGRPSHSCYTSCTHTPVKQNTNFKISSNSWAVTTNLPTPLSNRTNLM